MARNQTLYAPSVSREKVPFIANERMSSGFAAISVKVGTTGAVKASKTSANCLNTISVVTVLIELL